MKLDNYSLSYKINKYGGIWNLIGKNGLDFWVALITTVIFLLLYRFNVIELNWWNGTLSFFNIFSVITFFSLALLGFLYTYRSKFNDDNDFNTWLVEKDVIDELELFIDYPMYCIIINTIVLILYGILLILFKIPNEIMVILFAVPIFFITYGYAGFIYAVKTIVYYSHAHNKFKKINIDKQRVAR